jgi:hypothetical protein
MGKGEVYIDINGYFDGGPDGSICALVREAVFPAIRNRLLWLNTSYPPEYTN